jgi:hypothetical protein
MEIKMKKLVLVFCSVLILGFAPVASHAMNSNTSSSISSPLSIIDDLVKSLHALSDLLHTLEPIQKPMKGGNDNDGQFKGTAIYHKNGDIEMHGRGTTGTGGCVRVVFPDDIRLNTPLYRYDYSAR